MIKEKMLHNFLFLSLSFFYLLLLSLQIHLETLTFTDCITSIVEKTQAQLNKHVLAIKLGGKLLQQQTTKLIESYIERDLTDIKNEWR